MPAPPLPPKLPPPPPPAAAARVDDLPAWDLGARASQPTYCTSASPGNETPEETTAATVVVVAAAPRAPAPRSSLDTRSSSPRLPPPPPAAPSAPSCTAEDTRGCDRGSPGLSLAFRYLARPSAAAARACFHVFFSVEFERGVEVGVEEKKKRSPSSLLLPFSSSLSRTCSPPRTSIAARTSRTYPGNSTNIASADGTETERLLLEGRSPPSIIVVCVGGDVRASTGTRRQLGDRRQFWRCWRRDLLATRSKIWIREEGRGLRWKEGALPGRG